MRTALSRNGTLLTIPDALDIDALRNEWFAGQFGGSRSNWLGHVELRLREFFPRASSADLRLTARHSAPFYLASGPNVP